jgi:hypothetical protein
VGRAEGRPEEPRSGARDRLQRLTDLSGDPKGSLERWSGRHLGYEWPLLDTGSRYLSGAHL